MRRLYESTLNENIQFFPCVVVIGARQTGKTTLVRSLLPEWEYFDLERDADRAAIEADPALFLRLHPGKIIIDEAQELPELFRALRVAVDEQRDVSGRFVITGSSSPQLKDTVSETLAGRVGIIELSPLLLKEAAGRDNNPLVNLITSLAPVEQFVQTLTPTTSITVQQRYWFEGGFPEPWLRSDPRFHTLWMDNYFETYVARDVRRLFPGLDFSRFRRFLSTLAGLSGSVINYSEVARHLDTTPATVRDYFQIAEGTYLWRTIPAFVRSSLKRLVKHPKGYLRDSGLVHHQLRIRDAADLMSHPGMGTSFESCVIEEILRSFACAGEKVSPAYYRTGAGAEVDLILEGRFGIVPIEIKVSSTVNSRHLSSLRNFMAEFNCPLGLMINNDQRPRLLTENIASIPFSSI